MNRGTAFLFEIHGEEGDLQLTATSRASLVWEIERKLAEDGARPIFFYDRRATCWQPLAGLLPHAAASARCRDCLGWAGWPSTSVVSAAS
jgi:hypothetical protein